RRLGRGAGRAPDRPRPSLRRRAAPRLRMGPAWTPPAAAWGHFIGLRLKAYGLRSAPMPRVKIVLLVAVALAAGADAVPAGGAAESRALGVLQSELQRNYD